MASKRVSCILHVLKLSSVQSLLFRAKFVEFMDLRKEFPYFSNARTVRNCMERARRVAATRILTDALDNGTKYTMSEIQTFNAGGGFCTDQLV